MTNKYVIILKMQRKVAQVDHFSKRDLILAVLAILVVAWGVYYYTTYPTGFKFSKNAPEVTRASNALVPSFPVQFILEENISPIETALLNYETDNQKLWTVSYVSRLSAKELLSRYESLFGFTGWEITNQEKEKFISAKYAGWQITVRANDAPQVQINILER